MSGQAPARSSLPFPHDTLLRLIIPLIIKQFLLMTVGMADTVVVTTSDEAAVSGASLVDNISTPIIQVFSALSTSGAVVVPQYLGRQGTDNAKAVSKQFLYTTCALSLLLMGAALTLRQCILALTFGCVKADVMENALVYFLLTATTHSFTGTYSAGAALFRAIGNSKVSMFCSLVVNVINITANAVLIFDFDMRAAGVNIGTLVSRIATAVIIMASLSHSDHVLRVGGLLYFEFRGAIVKRILFVGVPNGMESGVFQIGELTVLNLTTTFSISAVTVDTIANSVIGVINIPDMALGLAIITVIGQYMGAGEVGQTVYYTKRLVRASYLCIPVMSTALFFSARGLVTLFHLSPEACTTATQVLRVCVIGNVPFWPLAFILPNSLRAAGDVVFIIAVSLGSMSVCRAVLSYVFACAWDLNLGLLGVRLAMIADWVVRAAFSLFRY